MNWFGTPPVTCNICKSKLVDVFYDAHTSRGWALVCNICFHNLGLKLGTGLGQKYDLKTKEKLAG